MARKELAFLDSHINFDGATAKANGLDGAIIRFGQGGNLKDTRDVLDPYIDISFLANRSQCILNKIPYGVLYQCLALTPETAEKEADWLLSQLKPVQAEVQIYVVLKAEDIPQYPRYGGKRKHLNTVVFGTIAQKLVRAGYKVMFYATPNTLLKLYPDSLFKQYPLWLERPGVTERIAFKDVPVRPTFWTYGTSSIYPGTGVCGDFTCLAGGKKYSVPLHVGDAVTLLKGTKLYSNAKDEIPCSHVYNTEWTRYLWNEEPIGRYKRYGVCLLRQFCGKPDKRLVTCYVSANDIEEGVWRARLQELG